MKGMIYVNIGERIEAIKAQVASIQGWQTDDEGSSLYRVARLEAPVPVIVELGSWKGKSTIWLANAVKDRGEGCIYAVDHWEGSAGEQIHSEMLKDYKDGQLFCEFLNNLRQNNLLEYVKPLKMDTISAAKLVGVNLDIGLLFVDASHEYPDVRRDFEFWSPMVVNDGFIIFHDSAWPGPQRLISELPKWYRIVSDGYLYILQKMDFK